MVDLTATAKERSKASRAEKAARKERKRLRAEKRARREQRNLKRSQSAQGAATDEEALEETAGGLTNHEESSQPDFTTNEVDSAVEEREVEDTSDWEADDFPPTSRPVYYSRVSESPTREEEQASTSPTPRQNSSSRESSPGETQALRPSSPILGETAAFSNSDSESVREASPVLGQSPRFSTPYQKRYVPSMSPILGESPRFSTPTRTLNESTQSPSTTPSSPGPDTSTRASTRSPTVERPALKRKATTKKQQQVQEDATEEEFITAEEQSGDEVSLPRQQAQPETGRKRSPRDMMDYFTSINRPTHTGKGHTHGEEQPKAGKLKPVTRKRKHNEDGQHSPPQITEYLSSDNAEKPSKRAKLIRAPQAKKVVPQQRPRAPSGLMDNSLTSISSEKAEGRFSEEEKQTAEAEVSRYGADHDMTLDEIKVCIAGGAIAGHGQERLLKERSGIYQAVKDVLPNRDRRSIRTFLRRLLKTAKGGPWSEEELGHLRELHARHGNKWSFIGQQLDRLPHDCRSRFEDWGVKDSRSTGKWQSEEKVELEQAVQEALVELRNTPGNEGLEDKALLSKIKWRALSRKLGGRRGFLQCRNKVFGMYGLRVKPTKPDSKKKKKGKEKKYKSAEFVTESADEDDEEDGDDGEDSAEESGTPGGQESVVISDGEEEDEEEDEDEDEGVEEDSDEELYAQ